MPRILIDKEFEVLSRVRRDNYFEYLKRKGYLGEPLRLINSILCKPRFRADRVVLERVFKEGYSLLSKPIERRGWATTAKQQAWQEHVLQPYLQLTGLKDLSQTKWITLAADYIDPDSEALLKPGSEPDRFFKAGGKPENLICITNDPVAHDKNMQKPKELAIKDYIADWHIALQELKDDGLLKPKCFNQAPGMLHFDSQNKVKPYLAGYVRESFEVLRGRTNWIMAVNLVVKYMGSGDTDEEIKQGFLKTFGFKEEMRRNRIVTDWKVAHSRTSVGEMGYIYFKQGV